jgi:hypothetical protein
MALWVCLQKQVVAERLRQQKTKIGRQRRVGEHLLLLISGQVRPTAANRRQEKIWSVPLCDTIKCSILGNFCGT